MRDPRWCAGSERRRRRRSGRPAWTGPSRPTLAVVRDDRWGRTYESYSEDPKIVADYAREMVIGLRGRGRDLPRPGPRHLHRQAFPGRRRHGRRARPGRQPVLRGRAAGIHAAGYPAAVDAGVQAVMASFSSWQGVKMHANASLLTEVLKDRLGFDGLVIGDWNAHGQVPGCTTGDCPTAFNAGVDVFNVPQDWKALYAHMVAEVKSGAIPMARLDDAVRRVLRVKLRAHVFDEPRPVGPAPCGRRALLGSPAHRAIARQAVRGVAGAAEERRRRAAGAAARAGAGGGRRGRQPGAPDRRLDAVLAGRRQHQRRLSRRDLDLERRRQGGRAPAAAGPS